MTHISRKIFSPTVIDKIYKFHHLLKKWGDKINLVGDISKLSMAQFFDRHILNCTWAFDVVEKYVDGDSPGVIIDVGTGAGFPGVLMAMFGFKKLHLAEINYKKVTFLRYIGSFIELEYAILDGDISKVSISSSPAGVIISRALGSVCEILSLTHRFIDNNTTVILYKTPKQIEHEIGEAGKFWEFTWDMSTYQNDTSVIILKNIRHLDS